MGFSAPQSHLCDDLFSSPVLILSGIPNLQAGTAAMFPELGQSTPKGQVTATWSSSPHLSKDALGAVSTKDSWGLYCSCAETEYEEHILDPSSRPLPNTSSLSE